MELKLSSDGDILSDLPRLLVGLSLDLKGGPHPNQLIGSSWRNVSVHLTDIIDELIALPSMTDPNSTRVADKFRHLVYAATELFDVYTQLFPNRLAPTTREEKVKIKEYQTTAKRLRKPWALVCNKLKHAGAQIAQIRTKSPFSVRFMVLAYRNGDALVRDDEIHKGLANGIGFVKAIHELLHALLRVHYQATQLAEGLQVQPIAETERETKIGVADPLRRLLGFLSVTVLPNESSKFDSLELTQTHVRLVRGTADRLPLQIQFTTVLSGDGHTKTLSFM